MKLIEQARRMKQSVMLRIHFAKEAYRFWVLQVRYNASMHTDDDMEKMQYTILRMNHTLEKGMSMRNPRKGFGQQKAEMILKSLSRYGSLYGQQAVDFLAYPLATIKAYINYTESHGVEIPAVKGLHEQLCRQYGFSVDSEKGGVRQETKANVLQHCKGDFASVLQSRHSIRFFEHQPERGQIEQALKLAQLTPSACNRQGWKTHVFWGEESVRLACWQGGANGFEEEIRCAILVTANLKAFLSGEYHQAYVDGGLYAMNLINALHSLGLGTIPLSCGFDYAKLRKLKSFGIPENEVPIVIIGVGSLPEHFHVAISERKDISQTNTFH